MEPEHQKPPPCHGLAELFYPPEGDGRQEVERASRETHAKSICFGCEYRMICLERSLVLRQDQGIWGGMTEAERRAFRKHLRSEGYDECPEGDELWAALNSFYRSQEQGA